MVNLDNKSILILGFGNEGASTLDYINSNFDPKRIGIADINTEKQVEIDKLNQALEIKLETHLGDNYLENISEYDVVVKAPGIYGKLDDLIEYEARGGILTSQTEIFFNTFPGRIVGITGTKGKSTTTSLIYKILSSEASSVQMVGNIGRPALDLLSEASKESIAVYELSSHQLAEMKTSPHVAVVLNIIPEHLDYYKNEEEYVLAKQNICKFQNKDDFLVINPDHKYPMKFSDDSQANKILYSRNLSLQSGVMISSESIFRVEGGHKEEIIKIKDIPLIGKFNQENVAAAIAVATVFHISSKTIKESIISFKSLPHRLENIGEHNQITFFNDSLSTLPESTMAAISALGEKVETIILGGSERKRDYEELARVVEDSHIKTVILFPTTGDKIKKDLLRINTSKTLINATDMKSAIEAAYQHTAVNRICLLSPGSPSFGIFENYQDRGDQFKYWVRKLSHEKS